MYDVLIIGGGVTGAACLRELSRYRLKVALIEKENDIACGASRANSGIIHAGYDCVPGTQKARFNVEGSRMFPALVKEFGIPYRNIGSLVVGRAGSEDEIRTLYERGIKNSVRVEIVDRKRIEEIDPGIAPDMVVGLFAEDAAVISPYKFNIALADHAVINGAEVFTDAKALKIDHDGNAFTVHTPRGEFYAKVIINAAGAGAARVSALAGGEPYQTRHAVGEYYILDNSEKDEVKTVVFPLPDELGKGILVAPTADGNIILGPTAITREDSEDVSVSREGLARVRAGALKVFKPMNLRKVIRVFGGMRSTCGHDFIIEESASRPGLINLVGVCSPGLSSSPAIAVYVAELVKNIIPAEEKTEFLPYVKQKRFTELSKEELNELVKKDSRWGRLICRCEKVTEAEIVAAVHSPVPAVTVDAVKKRVRAGMGRCQGSFCGIKVMEIISRELDIPFSAVKKGGKDSQIAVLKIKEEL
ncbi:MAG: NAD(P)/FAD-dependent oxidoreductase [Clostridia bacterium]